MHPAKNTRIENGVSVRMDIFEYLFVHAQRLPDKDFLRPINKHKYSSRSRHATGENNKQKQTKELSADSPNCGDPRRQRKLFQRGLGLFNKLVVSDDEVTCSCENFRRFGKCEDSELLGFICLGEKGYPSSAMVDFNDWKEGYPVVSSRLRKKVLNLMDAKGMIVHVAAPSQDPSKLLQDPK